MKKKLDQLLGAVKNHAHFALFILIQTLRFLNSHLFGALILSVLAYFLWPRIFEVTPYDASQLLEWFMEQSETTKTLLATSMLTIMGFLIAFQAGTAATRKQLQAQFRLDLANQIDSTYPKILQQITQMEIYANLNLRLIEDIHAEKDEKELLSELKFILSKNQNFLATRECFLELQQEALGLFGRYSSVFFATWKTFEMLQQTNESIRVVSEKMWISTPEVDPTSPIWRKLYFIYADESRLERLSSQCKKTFPYVAGMTGMIKGIVTAPINEQNIFTFLNISQKGGST